MKRLFLFFFFSFLFLFSTISVAQQTKVDSLLHFLESTKEDTVKVNTLNTLTKEYINASNYKLSLLYSQKAKALAEKIQLPKQKEQGWPKGLANALNNIGNIYYNHGDFKTALEYHLQVSAIREKIGDKIGAGKSYSNIGITFRKLENIDKALDNFLKSLKIMEEVGNKKGVAQAYNNIGTLYNSQKNYDQALKYYFKSLKIAEELSDKSLLTTCYNNIGIVYKSQGSMASSKTMANDKYQKALENHFKVLSIEKELDDKRGLAVSYNNIGVTYFELGKIAINNIVSQKYYNNALENYFKSLEITKEIDDVFFICGNYDNIGNVYIQQNKLEESYNYLIQALKIAKEQGYKNSIQETYSILSDLFEKKQDFKQALEYHKLYNALKDTLLNETTSKQIAEMNTKYDTEKKDKELIKKDAEITKQQVESEKRQIQRNAFIIGFGLVLLLAVFIFRSYRNKQEANTMLEIKNEAINKQNKEIEKKNTVITDSIEYAKNIQQAILPTSEELKKHFKDHFILYKPKDIVSGDFYWIHEQEERLLFAVADCTGHGVPGAFMSLMGHSLLKEAVNGKGKPAEILDELNMEILKTLKQDNKNISAKYGMDIALISLDKNKTKLEYAGAHNSLYIFKNQPGGQSGRECIQLKGDAQSIGSMVKEEKNKFTNQSYQLEKGDMLYLFSDGYVDQKGGPEGKQFFSKPFRKLLQSICELDLSEQKQQLDTAIIDWQGNKKQTDDILVVGIRV